MKIIGLIAEYNPFHNGHLYHINQIKKMYPSSLLILILNGYFLERGEISVLSKETKTRLALENKIDIVVELPVLFGTQSADTFAEASLSLLNALKAEILIFGSESNNKEMLWQVATKQLNEEFTLNNEQKNLNYPKRINQSLQLENTLPPNDLLGISYCKAILKNHYQIEIETIKRTNNYHDTLSCDSIISATNIRTKKENKEDISPYLPSSALQNWQTIDKQKLFEFLKYRILTAENLNFYIDVTEGLDYKLKKEIAKATSFNELLSLLKSKRYTYNRLRRMLIHILLGHSKENSHPPITYIHILGFSLQGKKYLKENRKNFSLPTTIEKESIIYQEEKKAALIYDLLTHSNSSLFDKQNKPIIYTGNGSKESNQK